MSVKNQKIEHKWVSSTNRRQSRESINSVTECFQYLTCSHNTITFNKTILSYLTLSCICQQKLNTPSKQSGQPKEQSQNQTESQVFTMQITDSKLHINKNNVKHIFPLQNPDTEKKDYIRIKVSELFDIIINSYGFSQSIGKKLIIVSNDINQSNIPQKSCEIFEPDQLIRQAFRLRTLKLTSSVSQRKLVFADSSKDKQALSQSKKLNIKKNPDSPHKHLVQKQSLSSSIGLNKFSDIDLKSSIRKTKICLAFCDKKTDKSQMNISIKGVDFKKSMEKKTSRSISRPLKQNQSIKNPSQKKLNGMKTKSDSQRHPRNQKTIQNRQNQKQNKNMTPHMKHTPSLKKVQKFNQMSSFVENTNNESNLGSPIKKKRFQDEQYDSEISSLSFYTAEKQETEDKTEEVSDYEKVEKQKNSQMPLNKLTKNMPLSKSSRYLNKTTNHNKTENQKKGSNTLKNENSQISKNFSKNISQSKIAQVSRVLVAARKKNQ